MSQHDQVVDNANGLTFRTDINNALAALFSASSGLTEPTTKVAGQLWFDTSVPGTNVLKMRDQTNAFWITLYTASNPLDQVYARARDQRNVLYNGDCFFSGQAKATAVTANGAYVADGWKISQSLANITAQAFPSVTGTVQRGRGRLKFTCNTAKGSLAAGDYWTISHPVEGYDMLPSQWGGAGAQKVLLRFLFNGPAGTYGVSLVNGAGTLFYMQSFTVAAGEAGTDKVVVMQFPGPTSGTWPVDNSQALSLRICLAAGSTYQGAGAAWNASNVLGPASQFNGFSSTSNIFWLADVKLIFDFDNLNADPGFDPEDVATSLQRCQRYYCVGIRVSIIASTATSGQGMRWATWLPTAMRTSPALTLITAGTTTSSGAPAFQLSSTMSAEFTATPSATTQSGVQGYIYDADAQF